MAKKSSTVYLESKFWDLITDYQNDNNISSRNDALQFMLQEWNILRKVNFNNVNTNITLNKNDEPIEPKVEKPIEEVKVKDKEIDPRIADGIMAITGTMKSK